MAQLPTNQPTTPRLAIVGDDVAMLAGMVYDVDRCERFIARTMETERDYLEMYETTGEDETMIHFDEWTAGMRTRVLSAGRAARRRQSPPGGPRH